MNRALPKELLIDEYLAKEKPMHQIAREQGCAIVTIYNYIKKYDMKERWEKERSEDLSTR